MKRREFLISATAGAAAAAGFSRIGLARGAGQTGRPSQAVLDRIAIMTLNFQRILRVPDNEPSPERTLELSDIGEMLADTYGVHKVEFQHYHLASTEPAYLKDLRASLERTKSRATQINLEFSNLNISAPRQRDRLLAIDLTKAFVDHAVDLGAQRVMINQGQPTHENKVYSIPTLKTMVDYGKSRGIIVSAETRGGGGRRRAEAAAAAALAAGEPPPPSPPSSPEVWALLAEIIQGAGSYSNVDVGGARAANQEELHACLKLMAPFTAGTLHTRVNTAWDLATAMRYLERDLGWRGLYTIETGQGHEGTKLIYDVVVDTLSAL